MIAVILSVAVVGFVSYFVVRMNTAMFGSLNSGRIELQAQQYASNEAARLRYIDYTELAAQARDDIAGSNGFQKEIVLFAESNTTSTIKERTATINIFKAGDTIPRVTLDVVRTTADMFVSGVPVGTVITWAGSAAPNQGGTWLECNGQNCAAYPELVSILGKNTVPDYRGRFLEGSSISGEVKEAGLPNITGSIDNRREKGGNKLLEPLSFADEIDWNGVFYCISIGDVPIDLRSGDNSNYAVRAFGFDASRSNPIYGKSDTVQPASVTVRYFIKAM